MTDEVVCEGHEHHGARRVETIPDGALEDAANIFRTLGDVARLKTLLLLAHGEICVSELAQRSGDGLSTISQRLRLLKTQRLVKARRSGKHMFYSLADQHIADLIANGVAHAGEEAVPRRVGPSSTSKETSMSTLHTHHDHQHGPNCGHTAVEHEGHVDYLHDGHLHHQATNGTVSEHTIEVSRTNPTVCTPRHQCGAHSADHQHGPGCGHEAVPHGDHVDYLVNGHLHHPHGDHCDDHGKLPVASA